MDTVRVELPKIAEIYDYLVAPAEPLPDHSDVGFVFGRKSSHLIDAAADVLQVSDYLVVSGNVGKDSGNLPETATPESTYVIEGIAGPGIAIKTNRIFAETKALDGVEANRYGLVVIEHKIGLISLDSIVAVMHPVQTRRLGSALAKQIDRSGLSVQKLVHYPTKYSFNLESPFDQHEAVAELTRLEAYSKGHRPILDRPADMPEDLLEYAIVLEAGFKRSFKSQGIRNPSTAEDTDRSKSPIQTILMNVAPGANSIKRLGAYSLNFMHLARAATRQLIVPRLPF